MKFQFDGGLGDQLAGTAVIREYKRQFPDDMVRLQGVHYRDIWTRNPHVNSGRSENGKTAVLGLHANELLGSIAHSFAKQTAQSLGLDFQITNDTPEMHLSQAERDKGKAILAATIGVVPGPHTPRVAVMDSNAMWPSRRWPAEHFRQLVLSLRSQGWITLQIGSSGHDSYGNPPARVSCDYDLVDRTRLRESAAIMSAADVFIGNDSGGFHLAAAVGCPTVVMFGIKKWYARGYWNTTPAFPYQECEKTCMDLCEGPIRTGAFCLDTVRPWRVLEACEWSWQRHGLPRRLV